MTAQNNKPHGIMFHHFCSEKHCKGQGAITAEQFEDIIRYYGKNMLSAQEWYDKALNNSLAANDICVTFDDSLLNQYDVAVPVLKKYKITAFWFVYSSVLRGAIEMLEVYRKFRTLYFEKADDFYEEFFLKIKESPYNNDVEASLKNYSHDNWKHFQFYTKNDTKFRFIRGVLGPERYNGLMADMMSDHKIDIRTFAADLWMNEDQVRQLHKDGHIIGMHSHSHPVYISRLPISTQKTEYETNYQALKELLGAGPKTMSHPHNSYNEDTLGILKGLGIKLGFRANMQDGNYSILECPREDHAIVMRRIEG